jgi:hypothetical protein
VLIATGQRRHLEHHGHRRHPADHIGELVEILASTGQPSPAAAAGCAATGHPEALPGNPEPFGLVLN